MTQPPCLLRSREEGKSIFKRCLCSRIFKVTVIEHSRIPERGEEKPQTWGESEEERCRKGVQCKLFMCQVGRFFSSIMTALKVNSHVMTYIWVLLLISVYGFDNEVAAAFFKY